MFNNFVARTRLVNSNRNPSEPTAVPCIDTGLRDGQIVILDEIAQKKTKKKLFYLLSMYANTLISFRSRSNVATRRFPQIYRRIRETFPL